MTPDPNRDSTTDRPSLRWLPWALVLGAATWCLLIRVPLIANAAIHLDSDLAVDGLTLADAVEGRWRWHYPGTPHIGSAPVLLSWAQAKIWGPNPETLVSGGAIAHVLLLVSAFLLARSVFGKSVAIGSLLPLTFASTGMLWLSGRITGGHLPVVAWSAMAWTLLASALRQGEIKLWAILGFWCGLGVWLDSMFILTLGGMIVAVAVALGLWLWDARISDAHRVASEFDSMNGRGHTIVLALALGSAFLAGLAPRFIGKAKEPHDPYHEQFAGSLDPRLLVEHSRILFLDCLPRLICGHRLPGLEADPEPSLLGSPAPIQVSRSTRTHRNGSTLTLALPLTVLALGTFAIGFGMLIGSVFREGDSVSRSVAVGLLTTAVATVLGFVVNRNIFNADNYRYLVLLLIPWAVGCGLIWRRLNRLHGLWCVSGVVWAALFAFMFTLDTAAWYHRLGWVDAKHRPLRGEVDDPALRWLAENPQVRSIQGSYWDVYRLSFLTGGKVRGIPLGSYPNRFPEWSAELPGGVPQVLLVRPGDSTQQAAASALRTGGRVVYREKGLTIVSLSGHPARHEAP